MNNHVRHVKYTQEELEWMKENYPKLESREETYKRFCEVFGNTHSMSSFKTIALRNNWCKPKEFWHPTGRIPWNKDISEEEMEKHYPKERRSRITYRMKNRMEYEEKYGPIPEGYILSDLGNGEFMLMEKKIHKRMVTSKTLNKGEYTKAVYEYHVAKNQVEKLTGKQLKQLTKYNTEEYLQSIRPKHQSLFTDDQIKEIISLREQGYSYQKIAEIMGSHQTCIRRYYAKAMGLPCKC